MLRFISLSSSQLSDDVLNVVLRAVLELASVGADDRELHVFLADLLLHDALEDVKDETLCLNQGHVRVVLLLDVGHGGLTTAADSASLPLKEGARGVSLVKLRTAFVDTSNEQGHTVGAGHRLALLTFVALSEVDGEITHSLGDLLDGHSLAVVETVVLSLHSSVVNEDAGITHNATHRAAAVTVDL